MDGDCSYLKSREIEKSTEYYLPLLLGFFVRVGFIGKYYLITRE